MYRLFFIAKNNLKKKKSDVIVLTGLIMLAVMMMYISVSVLSHMSSLIDDLHDKTNSADWYLLGEAAYTDGVSEVIKEQAEVAAYEESQNYFVAVAGFQFTPEEEMQEFSFILADAEETYEICKIYPELTEALPENGIVLPYYMSLAFGCQTGDSFYLKLDGTMYEFQIAGFVEDPLFSNPLNISVYKCYLPYERLVEMSEAEAVVVPYAEYKVRLKEGENPQEFKQKISELLNQEVPELAQGNTISFDWSAMRGGDMMMANLCMSFLLIFAVILMCIALIMIRFSISNFCELNIKNIGVLRATGYTAKQLTGSFVMEMFLITIAGGVLGIVAGSASGKAVGNILSSVMGLSYQVQFDGMSALVIVLVSILVVLGITWISSRKYGSISVLDALREGIASHNFRKNYFPLEKTRQPLVLALGLKSILGAKLKNTSIFVIVTVLSLCSSIGFFMYQNFAVDMEFLLKMVGAEVGDAAYVGEDLDTLGHDIETMEEVEKVLYLSSFDIKVSYDDKEDAVTAFAWKDPSATEYTMLLEGRYPEYENEIVITSIIGDRLGVKIGDTINVEGTGGKKDYLIVGIDQKISNMGLIVVLNYEGVERLNGTCTTKQLYVYGKEGIEAQTLIDTLNERYPEREAADNRKALMNTLDIVALAMEAICMIFVLVTVVVVVLVVFLLIKAKVIRERKNYGVYKAIGFTNGQLCLQTILSNLPVMTLGAVAGTILSIFLAEPCVTTGLSYCGIEKCEMGPTPFWMIVTVIGITVVALVVAVITSARIRKIEPVKMLKDE